ncbi:hypothetical protein AAHH87_00425 [Candidatus Hodgkinia cicadicola]
MFESVSLRALLAVSGGGDSASAMSCTACNQSLTSAVAINHNLRYESECESALSLVGSRLVDSTGSQASLSFQRSSTLVELAHRFGFWQVLTAHTLLDNVELMLCRQRGASSAYCLCMPWLQPTLRLEFVKVWVLASLRKGVCAGYVFDIANADASLLRPMWRQVRERVRASTRSQWSVFARLRLAPALC